MSLSFTRNGGLCGFATSSPFKMMDMYVYWYMHVVSHVYSLNLQITDLIRYDSSRSDQTLVYILTLGVVESYRNFGIGRCLLLTAFAYWFIGTCHDILLSPSASALIREVTRYAKTIPTCRAAYLHVISYNTPAMYLYKKMSFTCVRRLYGFYVIHGQHYDAYLFVYYVNGGRSPCSPL